MHSSKLRIIPMVVGLVLLVGIIPGASARRAVQRTHVPEELAPVTTTVSMTWNARRTKFVGNVGMVAADVSLDEGGCLTDGRSVKLYKYVDGDLVRKDSTHSDETGFFVFNYDKKQSGKWEARVAQYAFADRYGDLVSCTGAKDTVRI